MKKPSKQQLKTGGIVGAVVGALVLGITSTLMYQSTVTRIKADGIVEYREKSCKDFSDKKTTWLECEVKEK